MESFENIKVNGTFSVGLWELKPDYQNKESVRYLNANYILSGYISGYNLLFIKTGENECEESQTKTLFVLDGNKMKSDETGLYFYSNYVNVRPSKIIRDNDFVASYFETAKELKSKENKLVRVLSKK